MLLRCKCFFLKTLALFDYEKIKGEWYVSYNLNEFKSALSNKYPIITGINVDNSFGELGANNPKYFAGPDSNEGHAVTIVGYDVILYFVFIDLFSGPFILMKRQCFLRLDCFNFIHVLLNKLQYLHFFL